MKQENLYTPKSIRTNSGQYVNVFDPDPDTILIEDIAHALSRLPRFGGHLPVRYSVAMHSIICCDVAHPDLRFDVLMHDATEAYLVDLPKPIRQEISQYNKIEDGLAKVLSKKFGFEYPFHPRVMDIDSEALVREWHEVFLKKHSLWSKSVFYISDMMAKRAFLNRFHKYKHKNGGQYL